MSAPRVLDVREAEAARPGQQAQTVHAAYVARDIVNGASCVILLSFVPRDEGGFLIEVGLSGSGPTGFGNTVRDAMRLAGDQLALAMEEQARQYAQRGRA